MGLYALVNLWFGCWKWNRKSRRRNSRVHLQLLSKGTGKQGPKGCLCHHNQTVVESNNTRKFGKDAAEVAGEGISSCGHEVAIVTSSGAGETAGEERKGTAMETEAIGENGPCNTTNHQEINCV